MPYEIQYTVADSKNKSATTTIKVPSGFAIADYVEFGQDLIVLAGAIMRGVVRSAQLCVVIDISGVTNNTISPLSDVENIGAFEFVTAQGNRVKLNVPGCPDLTLTNSDELDPTDPQTAAIITMMEDGLTGVQPCDVGGDDIVDTLFAREAFRNSGRRRA